MSDIGADERARHCHDHAGGDSLSARIADDDQQTVVVDLHEIIIVAADLFRGAGECMDDETSPHRELFRHEGELEIPRKRKFLIDTLLFAEVGIHLNNILRQHDL